MERVEFTKEMKKTHTILVPSMLPIHFRMLTTLLGTNGYKLVVLSDKDEAAIIETGLKYVHNDMCYPALLAIGQLIHGLESGEYDPHHCAVAITQTGGGCRASNYIHLLRKALVNAGMSYVPVISVSANGMEKNSGFTITLPLLLRFVYIFLYGDLLQWLHNQTKPYEIEKGASDALCHAWCDKINTYCKSGKYRYVNQISKAIINDFANIPMVDTKKPKVGIVGEIYMKYAPLGNHHLEDFLIENGCEPVLSGVMDFMLYSLKNNEYDYEYYRRSKKSRFLTEFGVKFIVHTQRLINKNIKANGKFREMDDFEEIIQDGNDILDHGVKMGEGWLLTHEMVGLIKSGVNNIISCQPFGCLPNHIVAKGMNKKIKQQYPNANIIAVDYDPSASHVNQENRIKMMIANMDLAQ